MIEYIKSLRWVDYFFFTLVEPRKLIVMMLKGERNPLPLSLFIVFITPVFKIIADASLSIQSPYLYYKITYGWLLSFFILFAEILIFASLIDLTCQFIGHNGNARTIINLVNFSMFPQILILPLVLIFSTLQFAPVFFYAFFSIALFIWSSIIIIQGISEIHQIPFSKSFMIFISPLILLGLIAFFCMILFSINIAGYFSNM